MEARLAPNDTIDQRYVIVWRAGQGKAGGAVYAARDVQSPNGHKKVALKFPVKAGELEVLKRLQEKCDEAGQECFWMPRVLSCGHFRGHPYAITQMLGRPLPAVFEKLKAATLSARWRTLRALGRLLLRRLRAIHEHGFVHCDVQPNNILMHCVGGEGLDERPFLVDFGTAEPFPGGPAQRSDRGTVDFNSIHSADGGVRGPCDDLESLGWVLCYGYAGELPWFEHTRTAQWSQGRLSEEDRPVICGKVRASKEQLLEADCASLGPRWEHLADTPLELIQFLRLSRDGCFAEAETFPNYEALVAALGGKRGQTLEEAERADLAEFGHACAAAEAGEEASDFRTLRNPGSEEPAPHLVEVEVRHAVEDKESIVVEVMSTCSVLDVRRAVLAKLGSSKLSEVKLVRRIDAGGNRTFATLDDSRPIDDVRKFFSMGRSLVCGGASNRNATSVEFTLEVALAVQADLERRFAADAFQAKLFALRQAHDFQVTRAFRKAHADLCFTVQCEVLPQYGFPATRMGLHSLLRAFHPHAHNEAIQLNDARINAAIAVDVPTM